MSIFIHVLINKFENYNVKYVIFLVLLGIKRFEPHDFIIFKTLVCHVSYVPFDIQTLELVRLFEVISTILTQFLALFLYLLLFFFREQCLALLFIFVKYILNTTRYQVFSDGFIVVIVIILFNAVIILYVLKCVERNFVL